MRRDLAAFITSAFALGFRRPDFLDLVATQRKREQPKGRAACYHWLLASSAILKEVCGGPCRRCDVDRPMRSSDSSDVDKRGRGLSVVEAVDVNLASPKRQRPATKFQSCRFFLTGTRWTLKNKEMQLVSQACRGDRETYWRLVEPYARTVFCIATAILIDLCEAEEVAQEGILRALSNIQLFRGQMKFSTWLIQLTINEARNKLRQGRRQEFVSSLDDLQTDNRNEFVPKDFTHWREIPPTALERKGLRDALQQALASLSLNCREVFALRDIAHLSTDETAQVLGIAVGTVKARLLTARLQIREALAPGFNSSWLNGEDEYQKAGT